MYIAVTANPSVLFPVRNMVCGQMAPRHIGTVSPRFHECLLAAPFGDFGVIATDQYLRYLPTAKVCRARVVRIVQQQVRSRRPKERSMLRPSYRRVDRN